VNGSEDPQMLNVLGDSITLSINKFKQLEELNQLDSYLQYSLGVINNGFYYSLQKALMRAEVNDKRIEDIALDYSPIFLLFFILLMAQAYRLVFLKNKLNYVNHAVFNLHFNSFVIFLLTINELVDLFGGNLAGWIFIVRIILYLFLAIIRFYKRKWTVTLAKLVMLFFFYMFLGIIFVLLILASAIVTIGVVNN